MFTIKEQYEIEIEVKKSTFISHLVTICNFESLYIELKKIHPKANHIVWAKRYLNEYNQVVENCSDDGEPKGTSGPPILNVMRGFELIECGLLVVRYFGGIKLGTGGLVRAYGSSAKEVIANAKLVEYVKKEKLDFFTIYSICDRFEHFIKKEGLEIIKKEYLADGVEWSLRLSEVEKSKFLDFATSYKRGVFKLLVEQ